MKDYLSGLLAAMLVVALALAAIFLIAVPANAQSGPPAPSCFPLVNGHPVGMPLVKDGPAGTHIFWLCGDPRKKEVHVTGFSCATGQCRPESLAMVISNITRASAKVGESKLWWSEFVGVDCASGPSEYANIRAMCAERTALIAENRPAWRVQGDAWIRDQAK